MKILNAIKKCWCIEQITQTFDLLDTGVLNLQILTLFFFYKIASLLGWFVFQVLSKLDKVFSYILKDFIVCGKRINLWVRARFLLLLI